MSGDKDIKFQPVKCEEPGAWARVLRQTVWEGRGGANGILNDWN
jgi:hypothetical protein